MKPFLACFAALCLGMSAASASAEGGTVPLAPQERESSVRHVSRWYGWQTLTSDAASLTLLLGGIAAADGHGFDGPNTPSGANVLLILSIAGYGAGPPVLHLVHRRPGAAAGSLALRAALPLLGAVAGLELASCPRAGGEWGNCGSSEALFGLGAGTLAAVVIDAAALSWAPREPSTPAAPQLGFAPVISNDGKRGELRVFGTF